MQRSDCRRLRSDKKTARFTIDTLVEMLSRAGRSVRLAMGRGLLA
ncbi:hypothetical protein ACFOEY_12485 [Paracandidimonas soli]